MTRICPKCRADLASVPVRNGKLRCPECGAILSQVHNDDRLQAAPTTARPVVEAADHSRRAPKEGRRADNRQSASALPLVLILVGLGSGLVFFLVIGGGVAAYLYLNSPTDSATVVSAPAVERIDAVRIAQPNPRPDLKNMPGGLPEQDGPGQANPEPAKEPIQHVQPALEPVAASGTLPLKELKAATVYVQAETATVLSMGSGFVVQAQGNTAFVVTNHHVISPHLEKEDGAPQQPSGNPGMPGTPVGPRPPFGPRMPIGPRFPRRYSSLEGPTGSSASKFTVVFHSGTAKEQALPATVVGDDAVNDLALLRIVGVVDAPRPINYQNAPELHETMPVVMFGFPLGRLLDRNKKYPAITVTKGTVSSLRGGGEQMDKVQLDIDMNPGNSGGPMVNEKGVLIGVAYSGLNSTHINFAIPIYKLNRFLQARIDPPTALESVLIGGKQQFRVRTTVSDPLGKLLSLKLLYGLATEVRMPWKGPSGWDPISGAKSSEFVLQGAEAVAIVPLTAPTSGQLQIIAQVSYRTANGQLVHGEPRTLTLGSANLPVTVAKTPPKDKPAPGPVSAPCPSRPLKGEELTKLLADLKSTEAATRQRAVEMAKSVGLLAYWSFDEGAGKRAADTSGSDLHAKLVDAGRTEGIRGKALRLTGPGSYLDYGDSPRLSFAARASFTIAFWTRTTRARGTLLSQRNSRDGSAVLDILIDDGKAKAQVRQDGNDIFGPTEVSSETINNGEWHHLALARQGDEIELFLDGVSQGRRNGILSAGPITTDLRALGSERYWTSHRAFGDPHFEGDMDEFCIFERALKVGELAALAKR